MTDFSLTASCSEACKQVGQPCTDHDLAIGIAASAGAPLSATQLDHWLTNQTDIEDPPRNYPVALRISGPLSLGAVRSALQTIVERHAVLRTAIARHDGQPKPHVLQNAYIDLAVTDLRDMDPDDLESELDWLISENIHQTFDMAQPPLLRSYLLQLDEHEYVLLLVAHMSVFDFESESVLIKEFCDIYSSHLNGQVPNQDRFAVQFTGFARLSDDALREHESFWVNQFARLPEPLNLPFDGPHLPAQPRLGVTSTRGANTISLDRLRSLADEEGTTMDTVMLAAFKALLHLYTGQRDIVVAIPVSLRHRCESLSTLIGNFGNTVLLRTQIAAKATFRDLLRLVRDNAGAVMQHQEYPIEAVHSAIGRLHSTGIEALSQAWLRYGRKSNIGECGDFTVEQIDANYRLIKHDWEIDIFEGADGLKLYLSYSPELFGRSTVERVLEHFQQLLESIASNPDRNLIRLLDVDSPTQSEESTPKGNSKPSIIDASIVDLFRERVAQHPFHIAIQADKDEVTYTALDQRANCVANAILARMPEGGGRVALLFGTGVNSIAAVLGALKAGKTYVPLDSTYPAHRLELIIGDAQVGAIIADPATIDIARQLAGDRLPVIELGDSIGAELSHDPMVAVSPDAPAYIIYTSGSTGLPKGVVQNHRNVIHFIDAYHKCLQILPQDRVSLLPSYSVDAGVIDVYSTLLHGATLLPADLRSMDFQALAKWIHSERITIYHSTPTVFRYFMDSLAPGVRCNTVRAVVLGGEPAIRTDLDAFSDHFGAGAMFVNLYGSTESSLSLLHVMDGETELNRVSIAAGYPVDETEVILLNDIGEQVPIFGEIAISGPHIALQYWERASLSAQVFPVDPATGTRIYRSGDLGRILADGTLEVLGRKDFQVKIRGYRVEIGEIEAVLGTHAGVAQCAVVFSGERPGEECLTAFFIPRSPDDSPGGADLRRFLMDELPEFMVPARYVALDALPLTATRKIDRKRLALSLAPG